MVTGAGRNIGKDIALAFAREGANVVVCDLNAENARNTAAEAETLGVGAMAAPGDITDAVLFLAGQDFITGQNIVVDGGRCLGPSHR